MAEQPTEPAALAAASLLAAATVDEQGGQAGTSAWPGQARLAGLVRQAVTGRDLAAVLDDVDARPQDPVAVGALAQVLAALAAESPAFRGELARLVGQAEHDPTIGQLATTIAGNARVGKMVTIGHAGSVHVHLPPPAPQTVLDRLHRATTRGPLVANLPPRNPAFTGRVDLLGQLHASLQPGQAAAVVQVQAQALHGLGGIGKTQLVLEYAHAHAADYDLVWWVTAEQPAAIPGQLVALARRLGILEAADQAETIAVLWDELRSRDRWLMVFDNAEDPADLRPWWPPGSGRVLVTSRNPTWGGLAATIALDVLSRGEAVAFLQRRLGRDDPAFDQLADTLGDLPLALEQAAAYLEETATPLGEYLTLIDSNAKDLFALGRPATTEQTIATTWTVSTQRLRQETPAAEELLLLCAFLAPDDIPRSLPAQHPDTLPERLAATVRAPLAYQQAIGALRRYSLIAVSQDGQTLSVHRLVQAVTRHSLDPDSQRRWAATATRLVRAAFPADHTNPNAWTAYARLLPHALAVIDHTEELGVDSETTGWLLNEAALYLWQQADHAQARLLFERALAIYEAHRGADDPNVAQSLNNLANLLRSQGDLEHARTLHERALSIREMRLGPDHPDTAQSLNNLANLLYTQGDLDHARPLHERALAINERHLGPDHPDTAQSLNNLANLLYTQGDLDHARPLYERALAIWEARVGADHPDTAGSLNNLANLLATQGDLDHARPLYERALAINERHLGPDHPTSAATLTNLASVLSMQSDLDGARSLYERALAINERHLGPDHPATATTLTNLAMVRHNQGDLDGARPLYERALAVREARLGPDHPDTAHSLNSLAIVLLDQGDMDQARALHERALTIRETRLGADHPNTAESLNNLAVVLHEQGDIDHARTLHQKALAIREARLGPDHPDIADSLTNLAGIALDQGNLVDARPLLERALTIRETCLGPDHPDTVGSREALAVVVTELENQM